MTKNRASAIKENFKNKNIAINAINTFPCPSKQHLTVKTKKTPLKLLV